MVPRTTCAPRALSTLMATGSATTALADTESAHRVVGDAADKGQKGDTMRSESEVNRAIERYADTVNRICILHLKNRADTEDIFQTVF